MKRISRLTGKLFKNEFRQFDTIFWSLLFPIILFFILNAIFGGMNAQGFSLPVGVVKEDRISGVIDDVLEEVSGPAGPFSITHYESKDEAIDKLKQGREELVIVVPKGASTRMMAAMTIKAANIGAVQLEIYQVSGKQSSEMAADIMEQIINTVNLEIGRIQDDDYKAFSVSTKGLVTEERTSYNYSVYIFPGVTLMLILAVALFNTPLSLVFFRTNGTNKKLYTTPIRPFEYFASMFTNWLITMVLGFILLLVFASLFYEVGPKIMSMNYFLSVLFSMIVLLAFGMMVSSFATKLSTATVFGQVSMQVLMFLGGLYFPVFTLPWGVRWFVYVLPTTYLVELQRRFIGQSVSPMPFYVLIVVPLVWLVFSATVFAANFKKVMGYE